MTRLQKVIITIVGLLTLAVAVVCGYAIKVTNDAKKTANVIETDLNRPTRPVDTEEGEPTSILLMGIDEGIKTGELDRTKDYEGRSDTMIYVTLNPKKKQTTMVSLDRDLLVQIAGKKDENGQNIYAKLNEAYALGGREDGKKGAAKLAIETVETLLDVPVDHYVSINMQGLKDLIDAVGGIEVDNKYHFELDGVELYPGKQHLDGKKGLSYARHRYYNPETGMGDPSGDIGRQQRQREVVELVARKVISLDTITNYQKIFKAVEKNVETDLDWDEMMNLATGYTSVLSNIKKLQVAGQYYDFNGYYQIPAIHNLLTAQNEIKTQLGLPTEKILPNLKRLDSEEYYFDDRHITAEAGIRDGVDNQFYFDGNILRAPESVWQPERDLGNAESEEETQESTLNTTQAITTTEEFVAQ